MVAVVSHGGFLRTAGYHRCFSNADWRIFGIGEEEIMKTGTMVLRETLSTETVRGGMGRSDVGVFGISQTDLFEDRSRRKSFLSRMGWVKC